MNYPMKEFISFYFFRFLFLCVAHGTMRNLITSVAERTKFIFSYFIMPITYHLSLRELIVGFTEPVLQTMFGLQQY